MSVAIAKAFFVDLKLITDKLVQFSEDKSICIIHILEMDPLVSSGVALYLLPLSGQMAFTFFVLNH